MAEYALIYANSKIAPTAEDAAEALEQVIAAYIQIALREPNLFKFLYMNSDSSASLSDTDNDAIKATIALGNWSKGFLIPIRSQEKRSHAIYSIPSFTSTGSLPLPWRD